MEDVLNVPEGEDWRNVGAEARAVVFTAVGDEHAKASLLEGLWKLEEMVIDYAATLRYQQRVDDERYNKLRGRALGLSKTIRRLQTENERLEKENRWLREFQNRATLAMLGLLKENEELNSSVEKLWPRVAELEGWLERDAMEEDLLGRGGK